MSRREWALAVLLAASAGACAAFSPTTQRVTPAERARRAMTALQREAFALARYDLLVLASDCRSGRHGRDALLLLAAAELDTGNPDGSPRLARHLAARYLLLPDASPERLPLARSLYRLAFDLGGASGPAEGLLLADRAVASELDDASVLDDGGGSSEGGSPSEPGDGGAPGEAAPSSSPMEGQTLPDLAPRFDTCEGDVETASSGPLPTTPAPRTLRLQALQDELTAQADSLMLLRAELTSSADSVARLIAEIERIRALLKSGPPGLPPRDRR